MDKYLDQGWVASDYQILGLPAQALYIFDKLNKCHQVEYRLRRNLSEIWEYGDGEYRIIVYGRGLAKKLKDAGIELISGWTDKANKIGPEEFQFHFTTGNADKVLQLTQV